MSVEAIENALKARLAAASPLPKAWPNQDFEPTATGNLPYLACDIVKASTTDRTLCATSPAFVGILIVSVVVAKGTSTGTANSQAEAIAAAFPMNLRFPAGPLTIEVTQPPHVREGMTDGAYWRVPVRIPFLAHRSA